jgi:Tol biopolymer transport system component
MIAYGSGRNTLVASNVFVVPAAGGTPQRVAADLPWSGEPIWSPDGQSLLVRGMRGIGDRESLDYWVAPVRGGASEKTGLAQFLTENKLSIIQDFEWRGQSLLFAAGSDAFAIDLDPRSRRPRQLRRLATGTSWLGGARGTLTRFVFSALSYSQHLWMLPLDPATGRVTGQIQPLPHSGGVQIMPASSYDGRLLVYNQLTPSGWELCVRETSSGRDTVLITKHARAKMSPDGTKVAYSLFAPTHAGGEIYLMDSSGGEAQKLLGQMEQPVSIFGWTADGAQLVLYRLSPIRWFTFDLRSHQEKELLFEPQRVIHSVEPSPDFHWAAFNTKGEVNESVFIAPVRSGHSAAQSEWITIAKGPGANERPWWSPDGNLLYFLSDKDGHECIWGQRLNSATKHPIGEAFAVYHLHDSRRTPGDQLAGFGPAVTKDRLFFSLSEASGNVWIAEERN